jgi:activator of HSP90 ATPase
VKSLKEEVLINAPIEKVWQLLVNPTEIDGWGGGPSEMSDQKGFDFKLWGGDIWGKNIEVVKNKKLVQEWFAGPWEKPSIVTFTLSRQGKGTKLELDHQDIPDSDFEDIKTGWFNYYFDLLKKYAES